MFFAFKQPQIVVYQSCLPAGRFAIAATFWERKCKGLTGKLKYFALLSAFVASCQTHFFKTILNVVPLPNSLCFTYNSPL